MSGLFLPVNSRETLRRIQERLSQGAAPPAVIEELLPGSRDEAISWGRRLAGWDEYRQEYPAQVIALARVISLRGMRTFGLMLREDGRVVERPREGKRWQTPNPSATFRLALRGEEVRVEYTPGYFPNAGTDLIYFVSPHHPAQPHGLSATGHLGLLVPHDAVEACGGPEAYAALLADALLRGEGWEFNAAFEGKGPEGKQAPGRRPRRPAALGEHTAALADEQPAREPPAGPPRQRTLF